MEGSHVLANRSSNDLLVVFLKMDDTPHEPNLCKAEGLLHFCIAISAGAETGMQMPKDC